MNLTFAIMQVYPLLKLLFYLSWIYFFGIVKGVLFGVVFHHLYLVLMRKLYCLEHFSPGDRLFVFPPKEEMYNLMGFLVFDNDFELDRIKESIIERGIKTYKKLRCVQCIKFFDFWWKEIPLSDCLGKLNPLQVKRNYKKFNEIQDLIDLSYEELPKSFDLEKELPYQFTIIKNDEGKYRNVLILKFHHMLSDGLGFIGLITALGENYSLKIFPQSMKKTGPSICQIIFSALQFPYYLIMPFFQHFFTLKSGSTPFKNALKKTGLPKISISQQYDFATYSAISKSLNITFNDMMMTAFSAAIKAYCKDHFSFIPQRVISICPISNRGLPQNPKHLSITNDSSGIGCALTLIDDPIKDRAIITNEFKFKLRNIYLTKIVKFSADLCNTIIPYFLTKIMYRHIYAQCDILFSNVALTREPLIYGGSKIVELYPLISPMNSKSFIGIYSYNGKFSCTVCVDQCLEMNPEVFMKYVENQLNYILHNGNDNKLKVN